MSEWMVTYEDEHGCFTNSPEFFDIKAQAVEHGQRVGCAPLAKGHAVVLYRVSQEDVLREGA